MQVLEKSTQAPQDRNPDEFCHLEDRHGEIYCGHERPGPHCPTPYGGEETCPDCGRPTCPKCAVLSEVDSMFSGDEDDLPPVVFLWDPATGDKVAYIRAEDDEEKE